MPLGKLGPDVTFGIWSLDKHVSYPPGGLQTRLTACMMKIGKAKRPPCQQDILACATVESLLIGWEALVLSRLLS